MCLLTPSAEKPLTPTDVAVLSPQVLYFFPREEPEDLFIDNLLCLLALSAASWVQFILMSPMPISGADLVSEPQSL